MHYFYPQIFMIDFSADEYINFRNNLYLLIGINLIVSCYLNWKFQNSMKKGACRAKSIFHKQDWRNCLPEKERKNYRQFHSYF